MENWTESLHTLHIKVTLGLEVTKFGIGNVTETSVPAYNHIYLSWNIISSTINISYFFVASTVPAEIQVAQNNAEKEV